jgi:hypothetical protein
VAPRVSMDAVVILKEIPTHAGNQTRVVQPLAYLFYILAEQPVFFIFNSRGNILTELQGNAVMRSQN